MKFTTILLLISAVFSGTDLYVKYSGKSNNFNTIQQAVNKAASLKPNGEGSRVTIHIAPGKYREQVIVNTPYITFINDEPSKGTVTITWYYGIGYKYYSCDANGYYDANLAKKKSSRYIAAKWGATVQLWPNAKYFKASNIIFENSFNRFLLLLLKELHHLMLNPELLQKELLLSLLKLLMLNLMLANSIQVKILYILVLPQNSLENV